MTRQVVRIPLKADGALRLGIVADTHSRPNAAGVKHLAALGPDAILHAGDIGELSTLDGFRALAPVFAVRGNIDERVTDLPDQLTVELVGAGDRTLLRILLLHIGVAGPRLRADVSRSARAQKASLVVCGHSHVPFIGSDRGLTIFNPGSMGPRRFHLPIVFGSIDLAPSGVRLRHFECETGAPWNP
ncbi:MAG: metallophosphoesterase family protein [Myxococcaceae bacterium]